MNQPATFPTPPSWWQTAPGLLTGVATVITAVSTLFYQNCGPGQTPGPAAAESSQLTALTRGFNSGVFNQLSTIIQTRQGDANWVCLDNSTGTFDSRCSFARTSQMEAADGAMDEAIASYRTEVRAATCSWVFAPEERASDQVKALLAEGHAANLASLQSATQEQRNLLAGGDCRRHGPGWDSTCDVLRSSAIKTFDEEATREGDRYKRAANALNCSWFFSDWL